MLGPVGHVGFTVTDVEAAKAAFTEAFGLEWRPLLRTDKYLVTVRSGGTAYTQNIVAISVGSPHVELTQRIVDDAWRGIPGGPRIQHVGHTVEDIEAESTRLERLGFPLQLRGPGTPGWRYHYNPYTGTYIELSGPGAGAIPVLSSPRR